MSNFRDFVADPYDTPDPSEVLAKLDSLLNDMKQSRLHRDPFPLFPPFYTRPRPRREYGHKPISNIFRVSLDMKDYRQPEVEVKVVDDKVIVHGKHEEKIDEYGIVSREITRRIQLPPDVDADTVRCTFKPFGRLIIEATRKEKPLPENERIVPITVTYR